MCSLSLMEYSLRSLSFMLPFGWLIATRFSMWKYCFAGYWIVTALLVLLILRLTEVVKPEQWVVFHLLALNGIVLFVLVYGVIRIYIKQRIESKDNQIR